MNTREGKPTSPWMEYLGVIRLKNQVNPKRPDHVITGWKSHKARYDFDQSKYLPHQGKKECERRLKQR